ncbi:caspase family protein [Ferruginibacter profundus]
MNLNNLRYKSICLLPYIFLFQYLSYGQNNIGKVTIPLGHSAQITAVDISADGKYIITGSSDKTAIAWDARTGKEIRVLFINSPVRDLKISPDSRLLLIASGTNLSTNLKYTLWSIRTGKLVKELPFYGKKGFEFLPRDDMLLVPGFTTVPKNVNLLPLAEPEKIFETEKVTLYDLKNDKVLRTFDIGENFDNRSGTFRKTKINFINVNGKLYFISLREKTLSREDEQPVIDIWNVSDDHKPQWSILPNERIRQITSAASSSTFVTSSKNKVFIWSISSANPVDSLIAKASDYVDDVQISANGKFLYCLSSNRKIRNGINNRDAESFMQIWNFTTHEEVSSFKVPKDFSLKNVHFSPHGNYLLCTNENKTTIFDNKGIEMFSLTGHLMETKRMFFSTNDIYLASYAETAKELSKRLDVINVLLGESKKYMAQAGDTQFNKMMKTMFANPIDSLNSNAKKDKPIVVYLPAFNLATATGFMGQRWFSDLVINGTRIPITMETISQNKQLQVINNDYRSSGLEDFNILAANKNTQNVTGGILNISSSALSTIEPDTKLKTIVNNITHDSLNLLYLDSTEWIILNNKGYYKCSKNAAALLHYVSNNEEIISFEQLDLKYNRPDLILEALGSKDKALINAYHKTYTNRLARYKMDINAIENNIEVPEVEILERDQISINQQNESMHLHIKAAFKQSPLSRFNVWVNEVPLFSSTGISIKADAKHTFDTSFSIKLSDGRNKIEVSVYNASGIESYRYPLYLNYTSTKKKEPKTWFIGIGVNKYADPLHNNLKYSLEDIRSLVTSLSAKLGNQLIVDTLFNNNFTINNIFFLKEKLANAEINDRIILVYSGHGILGKDGKYYFPTSSMNARDFTNPESMAISYEAIEQILDNTSARNKLFLIDACHSGIVDPKAETVLDSTTTTQIMEELFTYVGRGNGATILASSSGDSKSQESDKLKHGFFIQVMLNAIKEFNTISVSSLKNYLLDQVPQISNLVQRPTVRSENREANFKVW